MRSDIAQITELASTECVIDLNQMRTPDMAGGRRTGAAQLLETALVSGRSRAFVAVQDLTLRELSGLRAARAYKGRWPATAAGFRPEVQEPDRH